MSGRILTTASAMALIFTMIGATAVFAQDTGGATTPQPPAAPNSARD